MRACGLCGAHLGKIPGTYTPAPPLIWHEAGGALACAIRAVDRMHTNPKSALVLGAGPRGLLMIQLLRLRGTETLLASEGSPMRAERARRLGAALVWDPMTQDVPAATRKETEGLGADAAVVATGDVRAIAQAVRAVRSRGPVLLLGVPQARVPARADPQRFGAPAGSPAP